MKDGSTAGLSPLVMATAIAVLIAWTIFVVYMATTVTGATEIVWSRLAFLLGSIEAIAFAAAGALFGSQVQRGRVADAKEIAKKSMAEASENRDDAVKGRSLAEFIKSDTAARTGIDIVPEAAPPKLEAIAKMAHQLFPD